MSTYEDEMSKRKRGEQFTRAVQLYALTIAAKEGVDRSYPHRTGRRDINGRFRVRPNHHARIEEHIHKIRKLITGREEALKALSLLGDRMLKDAKGIADDIADGVLDECSCRECWRAR